MADAGTISNWTPELDPLLEPDLARAALLLIDLQKDFIDGASPVAGTAAVLPAIGRLLEAFREAGLPIVHVIRLYEGDDVDRIRRASIAAGAPIVRPGSPGSQIAAALRPAGSAELDHELLLGRGWQLLGPNESVMWKPRWSAFHRTALHRQLAAPGIDTVVVAGCNYPNCPRATITDATAYDYRTLIASDAISGILAHHLEEAERIGAVHASTDTICAAVAGARLEAQGSEERGDPVDGGGTDDDLQDDPAGAHQRADHGDQDVAQQHPE